MLHRPAALAESVFGGVKSKMQNLRAALAAKEDMLQSMGQVGHSRSRPSGLSFVLAATLYAMACIALQQGQACGHTRMPLYLTVPPLVLQELQSLRESHQQQLQQQAAAHQQQLAAVAAESSASLSRHMGLIDKLMDEKGVLASRLDDAQKAAVVSPGLGPIDGTGCLDTTPIPICTAEHALQQS